MKILIISDSHGNIANLKHILGFAKKIGVSAVIHAGDWNTIEAVETVLFFGIPLYTVLGNADIDMQIANRLRTTAKKFDDDFLEIELGGRKIGIVHRFKIHNLRFKNGDIVFCGHIHSKDDRIIDGIRVVRPGAVINGNNFAIYETITNKVEFIED